MPARMALFAPAEQPRRVVVIWAALPYTWAPWGLHRWPTIRPPLQPTGRLPALAGGHSLQVSHHRCRALPPRRRRASASRCLRLPSMLGARGKRRALCAVPSSGVACRRKPEESRLINGA
jgi:hypothetical protein